ncbi:MAG: hypothetical protein V1856_02370 [Candidatus Liptonbacteria bacterium]
MVEILRRTVQRWNSFGSFAHGVLMRMKDFRKGPPRGARAKPKGPADDLEKIDRRGERGAIRGLRSSLKRR